MFGVKGFDLGRRETGADAGAGPDTTPPTFRRIWNVEVVRKGLDPGEARRV